VYRVPLLVSRAPAALDAGDVELTMKKTWPLDRIQISVRSHHLLRRLLEENPKLDEIMRNAHNETEVLVGVRNWILGELQSRPAALDFYESTKDRQESFEALEWKDYAAIRILDYIDNAGREFEDLNLRGQIAISNPIKLIWLAVTYGTGGAKPYFFEDMLELFRQLSGKSRQTRPSREQVEEWMSRHPSGLDPRIIKLREENRDRILNVLIDRILGGEIASERFRFEPGVSREQMFQRALEWWQDRRFHLRFAVRSADMLNEMLGHSLDPDTMKILHDAEGAGIPFFVNPYYLSLLHVRVPYFAIGADLAIRDYVIYSRELVDGFGQIVAWEKEDRIEPGKPNAAGWLLPSQGEVHRRYPDVAIMIPDTGGRACAGLCSSCQRMYGFQRGHLSFDLDGLEPRASWPERLARVMEYFENDSQLRDILITGGDALMSSDSSLAQILEAVYEMALAKRQANQERAEGDKYAELVRVRLGTRLPVYLPQRVTPELVRILGDFKSRASRAGVKQFVVQTHFESPMEVTPEAREAVRRLLSAGWTVANQHVFTASASRRGHNAKLRQLLGRIGVLPYYTFSVKGYTENRHSFATNARAVQEQMEEKALGTIPPEHQPTVQRLPLETQKLVENVETLQRNAGLPFLGTDRNVLNLPGVGKSLTFRVIGITRYGRRILQFDHDASRRHSPIIDKLGRMVIIESKSISAYLKQLEEMGEDVSEYATIWGYSLGVTESRLPLFEYPEYGYAVTEKTTNFDPTSR